MEEKVLKIGDRFTVTYSDESMRIEAEGLGWSLSLGKELAMMKSLLQYIEDGEVDFVDFMVNMMLFDTTVLGDEEHMKEKMRINDALYRRIEKFRKTFASEKDAKTVADIAKGMEDEA